MWKRTLAILLLLVAGAMVASVQPAWAQGTFDCLCTGANPQTDDATYNIDGLCLINGQETPWQAANVQCDDAFRADPVVCASAWAQANPIDVLEPAPPAESLRMSMSCIPYSQTVEFVNHGQECNNTNILCNPDDVQDVFDPTPICGPADDGVMRCLWPSAVDEGATCLSTAECESGLRCELGTCVRVDPDDDDDPLSAFNYCQQVPESSGQRQACIGCVSQGEPGDYAYTAVGCVPTEERGLVFSLVRLMFGVAGGLALLTILAGAFLYTISSGDSAKTKQARELITAAVQGLLFMIFSIFILQFIGGQILNIPGLANTPTESSTGPNPPISAGPPLPDNPINPTNCTLGSLPPTADKPCCQGYPEVNGRCVAVSTLAWAGFIQIPESPSAQFCITAYDASAFDSLSFSNTSVECTQPRGGITCNYLPNQSLPTTLSEPAIDPSPGNDRPIRCTQPINMFGTLQTAFNQYYTDLIGPANTDQFTVRIANHRGAGANAYYDITLEIEQPLWDELPQSTKDTINQRAGLDIRPTFSWGGTILGNEVGDDSSLYWYATVNDIQIVPFNPSN